MKRITRLNLNGKTLKVLYPKKIPETNMNVEYRGMWRPAQNAMDIVSNDADYTSTVLHEALHAIWDEYELPPQHEEQCVSAVENGIRSLFRNNPEFAKEFMKG